jgi:hypothetical protein
LLHTGHGRFVDQSAAALGGALPFELVDGLAHGQDAQETPEIVAVGQVRESPLAGSPTETVERAQGRILLILDRTTPSPPSKFIAGQVDESAEAPLPEVLCGRIATDFEAADPARDGRPSSYSI